MPDVSLSPLTQTERKTMVINGIYVQTIIMTLPPQVKAFVHLNYDGSYTIFVDADLNLADQQLAWLHEVEHIERNDFQSNDSIDAIELRASEK